jgi:hypothetical protein
MRNEVSIEEPTAVLDLYAEEMIVEPLETVIAANTSACVFTAGSFACAGSCGSSLGTGSSFSTATG